MTSYPKRRSPRRKYPKKRSKTPKRKTPRRKSPKRKSRSKSPKRKSPKRKSRSKSPKRKSKSPAKLSRSEFMAYAKANGMRVDGMLKLATKDHKFTKAQIDKAIKQAKDKKKKTLKMDMFGFSKADIERTRQKLNAKANETDVERAAKVPLPN
jgi:hypothetical protein